MILIRIQEFLSCVFSLQVMDKLSVNASRDGDAASRDRDAALLQPLSQALLHMMEAGEVKALTSSDVLYLTQMVDKDWTPLMGGANADADLMLSVATNYVKMASWMLEPGSVQWTDPAGGVRGARTASTRSEPAVLELLSVSAGPAGPVRCDPEHRQTHGDAGGHARCWTPRLHAVHQEHT